MKRRSFLKGLLGLAAAPKVLSEIEVPKMPVGGVVSHSGASVRRDDAYSYTARWDEDEAADRYEVQVTRDGVIHQQAVVRGPRYSFRVPKDGRAMSVRVRAVGA